MTLDIHMDVVPLRTSADGVVYVGNTRVPIETVVNTFNEGASAEEIAAQYPALSLSQIYQTIGYYLAYQIEVDAYIKNAERHSKRVKAENQARFNLAELRQRLLQRQLRG